MVASHTSTTCRQTLGHSRRLTEEPVAETAQRPANSVCAGTWLWTKIVDRAPDRYPAPDALGGGHRDSPPATSRDHLRHRDGAMKIDDAQKNAS